MSEENTNTEEVNTTTEAEKPSFLEKAKGMIGMKAKEAPSKAAEIVLHAPKEYRSEILQLSTRMGLGEDLRIEDDGDCLRIELDKPAVLNSGRLGALLRRGDKLSTEKRRQVERKAKAEAYAKSKAKKKD